MTTLTDAHAELFRRAPDERFDSVQALFEHCQREKSESTDRWAAPESIRPAPEAGRLALCVDTDQFTFNDWSFGQVCRLAGVQKDTVNRLSVDTAARVLAETMPGSGKPLQLLSRNGDVRAVHGASYTRLHNADLLVMLKEFATDFEPPQRGVGGATGLYCGEQDMFCFLIDPAGWTDIDGEAFAPGFFLWNSEVGRRSLGIKTFWFQAVCQNHIVWDTVEVVDFARKHTANVHEGVGRIREILLRLVETRDRRRDGFVDVIRRAMRERLGDDADEVLKVLQQRGVARAAAKEALQIAEGQGRFTVFAIVDALTRISARMKFAGDRVEADEAAAGLFALVAQEHAVA